MGLNPDLGFLLRVLRRQQTKPGIDGKLMVICGLLKLPWNAVAGYRGKHGALYSLFRLKELLQRGDNA